MVPPSTPTTTLPPLLPTRGIRSRHLIRLLNTTTKTPPACLNTQLTTPIHPAANSLRHIEFTQLLKFEDGLKIQERLVRHNLDVKDLHARVVSILGESQLSKGRQHDISTKLKTVELGPVILTFQFEPTFTGGKRIKKTITEELISEFEHFVPENEVDNPAPVFIQVERGGEITFHGPGQMVAYIIMDLKMFRDFPARRQIAAIENATRNLLWNLRSKSGSGAQLSLETGRLEDKTGVWTLQNEKIASIGVNVRRSITSHGVCINVNPDLSYLNTFEMCGTPGGVATSIAKQAPSQFDVGIHEVAVGFVEEFAKLLGIANIERVTVSDMQEIVC